MGEPYRRNDDGSLTPAEPMGWQGGIDWEVYDNERPRRAMAYDEDVLLAVVTARTRIGLHRRMVKARRKIERG